MWGDENATDSEIEKAAGRPRHGFISSFADGYETGLGRAALTYRRSKAKLCIARALLKKPKF